jgi:hypothetical protein
MSKKSNVNPGQYKVAGRERQGEEVVHDDQKKMMTQRSNSQGPGSPNFIPGALPVGVSPKDVEKDEESSDARKNAKKK